MKPLTSKGTDSIKNKAGLYRIYDARGKMVYVGTSKTLRKRVKTYHQKDDFTVNRTKKALRPHAKKFRVEYKAITKARKTEKRIKGKCKFNYR